MAGPGCWRAQALALVLLAAAAAAQQCTLGQLKDGGGVCGPCLAGFFCVDGVATMCAPASSCMAGQLATPCSNTTDLTCGACTQDSFCQGGAATACSPTGNCAAGTLEVACSPSANLKCDPCPMNSFCVNGVATACDPTGNCAAGEEEVACSPSANLKCDPCPMNSFCVNGVATACDPTGNCAAGEEEVACSPSANLKCDPCPMNSFCVNGVATACDPTGNCAAGEEEVACSPTANLKCDPCPMNSFCVNGVATACDPTGNCAAGEEEVACSPSANLKCDPCPMNSFCVNGVATACDPTGNCAAGEEEVACSPTANLKCDPCPMNSFCQGGVATACDPTGNCAAGEEEVACSPTANLKCDPCPMNSFCQGGVATACSPPRTNCARGTFPVACSSTKDAFCDACGPTEFCTGNTAQPQACTPPPTTCPAGKRILACNRQRNSGCFGCPTTDFCLGGAAPAQPCNPPRTDCAAGTFPVACSRSKDVSCDACGGTEFCVGGSTPAQQCSAPPTNCAAGTFPQACSRSKDAFCDACPPGNFCPGGATAPTPCSALPTDCAAGMHAVPCTNTGTLDSRCVTCPAGSFCLGMAQPAVTCSPTPNNCQPGFRAQTCIATRDARCGACPGTQFCLGADTPAQTCSATPTDCPVGERGLGCVRTRNSGCFACPPGFFCLGQAAPAVACSGALTNCMAGTFPDACTGAKDDSCEPCPVGSFFCDGGAEPVKACRTTCTPGFKLTPCSATGNGQCQPCAPGSSCQNGVETPCITTCSQPGTFLTACTAMAPARCDACPLDSFCAGGNVQPVPCLDTCAVGSALSQCRPDRQATCDACTTGFFCLGGTAPASACTASCPEGFSLTACTAGADATCQACPPSNFCLGGPNPAAACTASCPPGSSLTPCMATADATCPACPAGRFCLGGATPSQPCLDTCPAGRFLTTCTATANARCDACPSPGTMFCPGGAAQPMACRLGCPQGEFLTPCTSTSDGTCSPCPTGMFCRGAAAAPLPCTATCTPGFFLTQCQATADATCQGCPANSFCLGGISQPAACLATCVPGEHLLACTPSANAQCQTCPADSFCLGGAVAVQTCSQCMEGFKVQTACTSKVDTVCIGCEADTFRETPHLQSTCLACLAVCPAGEKELNACSSTKNRRCSVCLAEQFNPPNTDVCTACKTCSPGEEESSACQKTQDRVCVPCSVDTFQTRSTVGTPCAACTPTCAAGRYRVASCSSTKDLQCGNCIAGSTFTETANLAAACSTCAVCQPGQFRDRACTPTRNTDCKTCVSGKFQNQAGKGSCKTCSSTCPGGQVFDVECTASADRTCKTCAAGSFKTGNRNCQLCITTCPKGETRSRTCSSTVDARCSACSGTEFKDQTGFQACSACTTNCGNGMFIDIACTRTANAVCAACTVCAAGFTRTSGCNGVVDSVCRDVTPPVVTILGNNPQVHEAATPYFDAGATATDTSGELVSVVTAGQGFDTRLKRQFDVVYTSTDSSGNPGRATRVVDVRDTTKPVILILGSQVLTHERQAVYTDAGATATDTVDGPVTVTTQNNVKINVDGDYTVVYTAVDSAGNRQTATRMVKVVDNNIPFINLVGPSTLLQEAGVAFTDPGFQARDGPEDITARVTVTGTVDTSRLGTYPLVYNVRDARGLAAIPVTRTVIVRDTINPTITLIGGIAVDVEGATTYTEQGWTAVDSFDGVLTANVTVTGRVDTTRPAGQEAILTYTVVDGSGNRFQIVRTVTVKDTTPPVVTLNGLNVITIEAGVAYTDQGFTASDSLVPRNALIVRVQSNVVSFPSTTPANFQVSHEVCDLSNNCATVVRMITMRDTTAPSIALTGPPQVTIEAATSYNDQGCTASDTLDGVLVATVRNAGDVDVRKVGTYTVECSTSDKAGNTASARRTVIVRDTTKPQLVLAGLAQMTLEGGTTFVDPLFDRVVDSLEGDLTARVLTSVVVKTAGKRFDPLECPSERFGSGLARRPSHSTVNVDGRAPVDTVYEITYSVSDLSQNEAVATRTVTVIDSSRPTLMLLGQRSEQLEFRAASRGAFRYVDQGITALDSLDGDLTDRICVQVEHLDALGRSVGLGARSLIGPSFDLNTLFRITYSVRDLAGRTRSVQRTVAVVDTTAPVVRLNGITPFRVPFGTVYREPGAVATDQHDGIITDSLLISDAATVDVSTPGEYMILYRSRDANNNVAEEVRVVVVDPLERPRLDEQVNITFALRANDWPALERDFVEEVARRTQGGFPFVFEAFDPDVEGSSRRRRRLLAGTRTTVSYGVRAANDLDWLSGDALLRAVPADAIGFVLDADVLANHAGDRAPSSGGGSSAGVIAGVVITVLIVAALVGVLVYRRRQGAGTSKGSVGPAETVDMYQNPLFANKPSNGVDSPIYEPTYEPAPDGTPGAPADFSTLASALLMDDSDEEEEGGVGDGPAGWGRTGESSTDDALYGNSEEMYSRPDKTMSIRARMARANAGEDDGPAPPRPPKSGEAGEIYKMPKNLLTGTGTGTDTGVGGGDPPGFGFGAAAAAAAMYEEPNAVPGAAEAAQKTYAATAEWDTAASHSPIQFVSPESVISKDSRFYHGDLSRAAAEKLLQGRKGFFLLRARKSHPDDRVLSIAAKPGSSEHHILSFGADGLFHINGKDLSAPCHTIAEVLDHLGDTKDHTSILLREGVAVGDAAPVPWLHGRISRSDAEARLTDAGGAVGVFLVRESSKGGKFALSLVGANGQFYHHLVEHSAGGMTVNGKAIAPKCGTLEELIEALHGEAATSTTKLGTPCLNPDAQSTV